MIKRVLKLRNVIAIAICLAVTSMMFSGCKDNDDNGGNNGNGGGTGITDKEPKLENAYFGNILKLSGQVYKQSNDPTKPPHEKWNGNVTISWDDYYGEGSGKITNGQLSFTLSNFDPNSTWNTIGGIFGDLNLFMVDHLYDDVKYEPSSEIRAFDLWGLETESDEYYGVAKENVILTEKGMFQRLAIYIWVEEDVRLTAKGKKGEYTITEDIDLPFKAGWNAVYKKKVWSTEDIPNIIKLGNPDLLWVIGLD